MSAKVKEPDLFAEHTESLIDYFRQLLYLQEYCYTIRYDDTEHCTESETGAVLACINVTPDYLTFHLYISKKLRKMFEKGQSWNVANTLLHEMCHILTEPLYDIAVDAVTHTSKHFLESERERSTSKLTHIILRTIDKAQYAIKPARRRR